MFGTEEFFETARKAKMHSEDRILVLKRRPGSNTKDSKGLTDNRLFEGGNNLHCILSTHNNLWFFRYEIGLIPEPMKEHFTSFQKALAHARRYYGSRGLDITEIIDV